MEKILCTGNIYGQNFICIIPVRMYTVNVCTCMPVMMQAAHRHLQYDMPVYRAANLRSALNCCITL